MSLFLAVLVHSGSISIEMLSFHLLRIGRLQHSLLLRMLVYGAVGCLAATSAVTLVMAGGVLWFLPAIFLPYRLINLLRAIALHTSVPRLTRVGLRSAWWLGLSAVILAGFSMFISRSLAYVQDVWLWFAVLQCVVAALVFVTTLINWRRTHPDYAVKPLSDSELPSLSVLVPARNETASLRECLESLLASNYPKLEIIALDDCSTNRKTPEILRSFAQKGVRFIAGKEPGERWIAKNNAYEELRTKASGELLLFAGVDVRVEPDTLRLLVQTLVGEHKRVLSILPLRPMDERLHFSPIQSMRYWWELCFPRRMLRRPPVLSTLWLIYADELAAAGGFKAAARMITPEAYFARRAARLGRYIFMRSTPKIPIFSTKVQSEQLETAIRIRYPQIHHRLSLVVLTSIFELIFFVLPYLTIIAIVFSKQPLHYLVVNIATIGFLTATIYFVGIRTHLNHPVIGILIAPFMYLIDIILLHVSMWKYEFDEIVWHDRTLNESMLEAIPSLPKID